MMNTMGPQRFKAGARQLMATMYYGTGRFKTRLQGKVVILMYHRVLTQKELAAHFIQPGMYVLADVFANHMRFVSEHFRVLSLGELFRHWRNGGFDKRTRYCVVTFDDGWLDNYLYAYPVLRRLGIPATIFLPTGFVGTDEWFWPDRLAYLLGRARPDGVALGGGGTVPRRRAVVSWEEVGEMARNGISFGSHSATHAILTTVAPRDLEREVGG